ncbi:MAG: twin-arginine translocase subunit TatC [Gammaproteobacteria bacterium]|nr:twin-arginine translocase subunit TatC [Gammaproteobacteria bacterium]
MSQSPDPDMAPGDNEQPFMSHLVELRDRLLRCVMVVLVVMVALLPFANDLYTFIADPLLKHLPAGTSMIATEVASPFLTPFKLALVLAIFASLPFIFYQVWAFVAPGLYQHERRMVLPLVVSSTFLFYLGMLFAYFVVFPLVFGFFTSTAPEGVAVMTDIARYLDFVLKLFFAFGVAFEVPIATIVLVSMGVTTPDALVAKRPYVIIVAFVVGMLLTPPDVISQTLLALPMWLLFEIGIFFSRAIVRRRDAGEEPSAEAGGGATPARPEPAIGGVESEAEFEAEFDRAQAEQAALERGGDAPEPEPEPEDGQRYTRDGLQDELDTQGDDGSGATPGAPDGDRPPNA